MTIKKYKYMPIQDDYELIRELPDISQAVVLNRMVEDRPYQGTPGYLYEAGCYENGRFDVKLAWGSENPHLFD